MFRMGSRVSLRGISPAIFFKKKIGVRWRGFRLEEPVVIGFVCLFRLVKSLGLHFVLVV